MSIISDSTVETTAKALKRGLDILEIIAEGDAPATYGQLRARSDMPPASFGRALKLLAARGYVRRDDAGAYVLGPGAARIGIAALRGSSLYSIARRHLDAIVSDTRESAEAVEFDGGEFVFVDRVECTRSVVLRARPGSRFPIGRHTAIGMLAMATGRGGSRKGVCEAALRRIRGRGFAELLQNNDEVYRAAAAVLGHGGECVGCLCVAAPAFRVGRAERTRFETILRVHAREASRSLGHPDETTATRGGGRRR
jgi:DNA-binding IclR family transcriptional regulator